MSKRRPKANGPDRDGPLVHFNVLRHADRVLVKQIELLPDKTLKKLHGGQIPQGSTITTEEKPLSKYVKDAFNGGVHQYILPANVEIGIDVPISHKDFVQPGGVDRTTKTLFYVEGPATLTLDHDPSPYSPHTLTEPEALVAILAKHFPDALSKAAWGAYDSSSSYIYDLEGNVINGRRGFHVVLAVEHGTDIEAFADLLFKRLWLEGYGYIHVGRTGAAYVRTIFDKKVVEAQQPLFAGGAHCTNCKQVRPTPQWHPGGYIHTAGVAALTREEERQFQSMVDAAKRAAQPECERRKRDYLNTEINALVVGKRISVESARRIVETRLGGTLLGTDTLKFDDFGAVTIAEVLSDPTRYDGATLADPIDGDVPGKGILYVNAATGVPLVYSHAHGGTTFYLRHDLASLLMRLGTMDGTQASASWINALPIATLRADEQEQYLAAVKGKTGVGLPALRKAARDELHRVARLGPTDPNQDPGLYLASILLSERYDGGALLLKLESGYFWTYTGTHWRSIKDSVLSGQLHVLAEKHWHRVLEMWSSLGKSPSTLAALVASALACVGSKVVVEGDPLRLNSTRPSVINCTNGELWLTDDGPQLRPHTPESYLTSCSPVQYDSTAVAPTYLLAIRGILSQAGGEPMPDQDEMLRHLEELMGYSIQTRRNLKVFVLVVGPGDNGKSRLAGLFDVILGSDAIAFDRLSGVNEDGNRFATMRLVGKQVLIDDDVDHEYLLPDGLLKKIAEKKQLTGEGKFKDPVTFVAQVVPWLLGNSWPRTRDLSRGMQTRANVLYLPRSFLRPAECNDTHPDRQRPELWDKIYGEEMSGVLNRLIDGYYRVAMRKGFLPPPSARQAFDMWLADANVVSRFIEEGCERIDANAPGITTSGLYIAFVTWAEQNGVQQRHRPQQNQLRKRLEEIGLRVSHTEHGTAVFGIKPRAEFDGFGGTNPFNDKNAQKRKRAKLKLAKAVGR